MSETVLVFDSECQELHTSDVRITSLHGGGAMSSLYEYELNFDYHPRGGIPDELLDGLLSHRCSVLRSQGSEVHPIHGILREIELVGVAEESPTRYRARLVPRAWTTTCGRHIRIFKNLNLRQLVDELLTLNGLEAEWWLSKDYPVREYVVQYDESDFAFISRQLEHYGIFYFFRQEPEGETLVVSDDHRPFLELENFGSLTFNPRLERSSAAGSLHEIEFSRRRRPSRVVLREHNYRNSANPLLVEEGADARTGTGYVWDYGEHFEDEAQGKILATARAEQLLNTRTTYRGTCSLPALAPGNKFTLLDCPIPELNIEYLVTSVEVSLDISVDDREEDVPFYRFSAFSLDHDVPYRARPVTPKPKIHGFMHAFIDGTSVGAPAPVDDHGRYDVRLPMDELDTDKQEASRWLRMIQPHVGHDYGVHFPLHVGDEVAIIHLDGDPDRPVILGAVPNDKTASPVCEADNTKDRIKTCSGIVMEFDNDVSPNSGS